MAAAKQPRGPERRSVTYETIENLLSERQEMWVLYERLAGVEPYEGKPEPKALSVDEASMRLLSKFILK